MSTSKRNSCDNQLAIGDSDNDKVNAGTQKNIGNRPENASFEFTTDSSPKATRKSEEDINSLATDLNNSIEGFDDSSLFNEGTGRQTSSSISSVSESGDKLSRLSDSKVSLHSTPALKTVSVGSSSTPISKDDNYEQLSDSVCKIDGLAISALSHKNSYFSDLGNPLAEFEKSTDFSAFKVSDNTSKLDIVKGDKSIKSTEKKEKKKGSWYTNLNRENSGKKISGLQPKIFGNRHIMMLNPSYKSKSDDFKRLFKDLPDTERLIVDYSCAIQRDILVQGRLYVSQNYICFYANIFRWETFVIIQCRDITSMTKEKTARVIPNAIQITTNTDKHFFASFGARDKTFLMLFRIWQNALLEQPMSSQELWQWVHYSYGEELGLTSDDDDYVAPPNIEEDKHNKAIELGLLKETSKKAAKLGLVNPSESVNDILLEGDNLSAVSYSGLNESSEHLPLDDINEECGQRVESEMSLSQKLSENPTDMSDTTESAGEIEDAEIICPCETHDGKELLNTTFPLSVDQVFSLIFTGSKFFFDLLASRKTYDIMDSPWQICPEIGLKMRQISYTVTLNHSMAKSTHTTETQRLLKHSKPGQVYTVDCDVVNTGIPYCDAFIVKSVYCLTRSSKRECRLRLFGGVHYKKKPMWGLVTSVIEKSAMQGLADFATDLEAALNKEAECSSQQGSVKKIRRRKRMKIDSGKCEMAKDTPRILQRQPTLRKIGQSLSKFDLGRVVSNPELVIIVILATLLILVFLNMLLFYKLYSLEGQNERHHSIPTWEIPYDSVSSIEKDDILQILKRQDSLHRAETEKWREALSEIIKLIHLVENSLSELRSSINIYSNNSILKTVMLKNGQSLEDAFPSSDSSSELPPLSNGNT